MVSWYCKKKSANFFKCLQPVHFCIDCLSIYIHLCAAPLDFGWYGAVLECLHDMVLLERINSLDINWGLLSAIICSGSCSMQKRRIANSSIVLVVVVTFKVILSVANSGGIITCGFPQL